MISLAYILSQSTPQPITGPLLAWAPGLQPRLAQWLKRPWGQDPPYLRVVPHKNII